MRGGRTLALLGGVLILFAVGVYAFRSDAPAPRSPREGPAFDADRTGPPEKELEGLDVAAPGGRLRVVAPPPVSGSVPVAVVDAESILFRGLVEVGTEFDLSSRIPLDRDILIFAFDDLGGSATLAALHAECEWPRPLLLRANQWKEVAVLEFRSSVEPSRIRVVARTTLGTPRPGVRFRISAATDFTTVDLPLAFMTTDADGVATSPAVASGAYRVDLQGSSPSERPTTPGPREVRVRDSEVSTIQFEFESAGRLRGRVEFVTKVPCSITVTQLDAADALPFVTSLVVNDASEFGLDSIPVGRYAAACWPDDHTRASAEFEVRPGATAEVVLVPGPSTAGSRISGRILDSNGQVVRRGVNVNRPLRPGQAPEGRGCRFDKEGRILLQGASEGPKLLILWELGYIRRISVPGTGETLDLGELTVPGRGGSGSLRGTVVDDHDVPLRGALVCIAPSRESDWIRFTRTDGGGAYRLDEIEPGEYLVWHEPMESTNYVQWDEPVTVPIRSEGSEYTLRLRRLR